LPLNSTNISVDSFLINSLILDNGGERIIIMQPQISINFAAVAVCVVSNFIIGFLWYGPLFGKKWAKEMGFSEDMKPETKVMIKSMLLMVIGAFFMSYVMAHSVQIWRPSVWGVGTDAVPWTYGFYAAFFSWIGYIVPVLFSSVSWEGKSWSLFSINAAYHLIALQVMGMILSYWR